MRKTFKAFNNDEAAKQKLLKYAQRRYAKGQKLSTAHLIEWSGVGESFSLPLWLVSLADTIYCRLSKPKYNQWPGTLLQATPVGANLEPVRYQFYDWLLSDSGFVPDSHIHVNPTAVPRTLYRRAAAGDIPSNKEWAAAEKALAEKLVAFRFAYSALSLRHPHVLSYSLEFVISPRSKQPKRWALVAKKLVQLVKASE